MKNQSNTLGRANSFLRCRRVLSTVEPGYLRALIPEHAPEQGESWQSIFQDVERVIMPGVSYIFIARSLPYYLNCGTG